MNQFILKMVKANLLKRKRKTILMIFTITLSTLIMFCSVSFFLMVKNADHTKEQWDYHYIIKDQKEKIETSHLGYEETLEATTDHYIKDQNKIYGLHYLNPYVNYKMQDEHTYDIYFGYLFEITGDVESYIKKDNDQVVAVSIHSGYQLGDIIDFEILQRSNALGDKNQFGEVIDLESGQYSTVEAKQYIVAALYVPTKELEAVTGGLEYIYTLDQSYNQESYHFIKYSMMPLPTAEELADNMRMDLSQIYTNEEMVSQQRITTLLSNSQNIVTIFAFSFIVAFVAIFITIKNILLIGESETKIQFGILKSIGTNNKTIKKIKCIELMIIGFIGSVLGVILGEVMIKGILYYISTSSYGTMIHQNTMRIWIIVPIIILSTVITIFSGLRYYRKSFKTYPIEDFQKGYSFNFPIKTKSINNKLIIWRLFFIYNTRIKKQTRSLLNAFILLILSGVVFGTTLMFNINVRSDLNQNSEFHIGLNNLSFQEMFFNEKIVSNIYSYFKTENSNQENYGLKRLYMDRRLSSVRLINEKTEIVGSNLRLYDDTQMSELCSSYEYIGKCGNLEEGEIIYLIDKSMNYIDNMGELVNSFSTPVVKVGDILELRHEIYPNSKQVIVVGIIDLSTKNKDTIFASYGFKVFDFGFPYYIGHVDFIESFAFITEGIDSYSNVNSMLIIELENANTHTTVVNQIRKIMNELEVNPTHYYLTDTVANALELEFPLFVSEIIAYPLFIMLLVVFTINLFIATMGHIETKKHDLTILKSVGATNRQLHRVILLEYIEAYANSAMMTGLLFILLAVSMGWILGEEFLFHLGAHIVSGWIVSAVVLSPIPFVLVVANAYRLVNHVPVKKQEIDN